MITTGIIREVNLSGDGYNSNIYRVELPIFKSASDADNYHVIVDSNVCLPGGIYDCYSVGDFVYVGFVDNKFNCPIILGKIYKGIESISCGSVKHESLKVAGITNLSDDTTIGDINYSDLIESITYSKNFNNVNNFNSDRIIISNDLYSNTPINIGTWIDGNNLNRISYCWEKSIEANESFSKEITLPTSYKDFWWDNSLSYIDTIGQPFYLTSNNNFSLTIDKTNNKAIISGKVTKAFNKIFATLLFTN